tara:strand:- start:345 stop:734 length:390 start_codon:yes stop_codon:yes gene_type:complete
MKIFNFVNRMKNFLKIEKIELWARVGVLDQERQLGQLFNLDILLWSDFDQCSMNDDLKATLDYSLIIQKVKAQAKEISCLTIEKYSEEILKMIQSEFNPDKMEITLTKCRPPIDGFNGTVSIVKFLKNK